MDWYDGIVRVDVHVKGIIDGENVEQKETVYVEAKILVDVDWYGTDADGNRGVEIETYEDYEIEEENIIEKLEEETFDKVNEIKIIWESVNVEEIGEKIYV